MSAAFLVDDHSTELGSDRCRNEVTNYAYVAFGLGFAFGFRGSFLYSSAAFPGTSVFEFSKQLLSPEPRASTSETMSLTGHHGVGAGIDCVQNDEACRVEGDHGFGCAGSVVVRVRGLR